MTVNAFAPAYVAAVLFLFAHSRDAVDDSDDLQTQRVIQGPSRISPTDMPD